jgi:Flp pilus assembly protein TadG
MHASPSQNSERGQVLAIFALALVAIIAMTGLVLDGGSTFVQRRDMQNVADAAAMAAAYDYANTGSPSSAVAAAKAAAVANGYVEGTDGVAVDVVVDEGAVATTIEVSVGKPHQNSFSGIVGMPEWDVSTTATSIAGPANSAIGAAPIIFNEDAFNPNNTPQTDDQWYNEPGTGTDDVPEGAGEFNWTVYCTASGNECNGDSNDVSELITGTNESGSTITLGDTDIGPLNAGAHANLFSDLAALVGECFPVSIVADDGTFVGISMFCLTGSVGGETKSISGYFLTSYQGDVGWQMRINPNSAPGTSVFGATAVYLVN